MVNKKNFLKTKNIKFIFTKEILEQYLVELEFQRMREKQALSYNLSALRNGRI